MDIPPCDAPWPVAANSWTVSIRLCNPIVIAQPAVLSEPTVETAKQPSSSNVSQIQISPKIIIINPNINLDFGFLEIKDMKNAPRANPLSP